MKGRSLSWIAVAACWLACSSTKRAGPPGDDGTLSADAGPDTVLALPARDLSLFGHVIVRWSVVSGPTGVVLSAPWALATTATFTTPGDYVFGSPSPTGSTRPPATEK